MTFISLLLGTFASEDLACITAGVLIRRGHVGMLDAILACTAGIFIGDVGLWAFGRASRRALFARSWASRRLQSAKVDALRAWLRRNASQAIIASRFLPGTRLPLYLIAGLMELPGRVFAQWALLAAVLWTPALVLLTVGVGETLTGRVMALVGPRWIAEFALATAIVLLLRFARSISLRSVRL